MIWQWKLTSSLLAVLLAEIPEPGVSLIRFEHTLGLSALAVLLDGCHAHLVAAKFPSPSRPVLHTVLLPCRGWQ